MLETDYKLYQINTTGNFSYVLGGLTRYIELFFKKLFPNNYFKYTYISMMSSMEAMKNKDLYKAGYPHLAIKPEFTFEETSMGKLPYLFRVGEWISKNSKNYPLLLTNSEEDIYLSMVPDRIKVKYEFKIRTGTRMSLYNLTSYITHSIRINAPFFLNSVKLEAIIPNTILKGISDYKNLNLKNSIDLIEFETYLKKYSDYPIVKKIDSGTGNTVYTHQFITNLLVKFTEYPSVEFTEKGLSKDEESITTINADVELWTTLNYILKTKWDVLEDDTILDVDSLILDSPDLFYVYTTDSEIKKTKDDKSLIIKQDFISGVNMEIDELDIKPVFETYEIDKEIARVINNEISINSADTVTGWVTENCNLSVNTINKREGSSSLCLTKTITNEDVASITKSFTAMSLPEGGEIGFWLYLNEDVIYNRIKDIKVEFGTNDANCIYWTTDKTDLKFGWQYIKLMSSEGTTEGDYDSDVITFFKIIINTNLKTDIWIEDRFLIDDIKILHTFKYDDVFAIDLVGNNKLISKKLYDFNWKTFKLTLIKPLYNMEYSFLLYGKLDILKYLTNTPSSF